MIYNSIVLKWLLAILPLLLHLADVIRLSTFSKSIVKIEFIPTYYSFSRIFLQSEKGGQMEKRYINTIIISFPFILLLSPLLQMTSPVAMKFPYKKNCFLII